MIHLVLEIHVEINFSSLPSLLWAASLAPRMFPVCSQLLPLASSLLPLALNCSLVVGFRDCILKGCWDWVKLNEVRHFILITTVYNQHRNCAMLDCPRSELWWLLRLSEILGRHLFRVMSHLYSEAQFIYSPTNDVKRISHLRRDAPRDMPTLLHLRVSANVRQE